MKINNKIKENAKAKSRIRVKELLERESKVGKDILGLSNLSGTEREELNFLMNKYKFRGLPPTQEELIKEDLKAELYNWK